MLIAGPSKAGKSYGLIELCCAIAEGKQWLGWQCTKGRVLYVNLELDRASCLHRFKDIYEAMGWQPRNIRNLDIWNLRGKSVPMDKLAPKLIRRAAKKNYIAIIIDPIYKIITGDENSADQMAAFCNQFDLVCTELGCAVIYCHHHSKGSQGQKRSMDRASGSGVFARDPDALLDLIELDVTENVRKAEVDQEIIKLCCSYLDTNAMHWRDEVSQDDACVASKMLEYCRNRLCAAVYTELEQDISAAEKAVQNRTAWRVEGTLREFPKFQPKYLWFDYPRHRMDEIGVLKDLEADGEAPPWQRASGKAKKNAEKKAVSKKREFEDAVQNCNMGEPPTVKDLVNWYSSAGKEVPERTIRSWVKKFGFYIDKNNGKITKSEE
jgi:RecA-family ATPase